jgi:hypothetical protein
LTKLVLVLSNDIPLTNEEFNEIAQARRILNELTSFEEKYYCVCENYFDLEIAAHELALNHLLYTKIDAVEFYEAKVKFNRKLHALLSSVRLYLDSIDTHVKNIRKKEIHDDAIKKIKGQKYDTSVEYRILEEIRNHSQHKDQPIHSITFNSKYDEITDTISYESAFQFRYEHIADDRKFGARAREELKRLSNGFDLRSGTKKYFSAIAEIHLETRVLLEDFSNFAEITLRDYEQRWLAANPTLTSIGVVACHVENDLKSESVEAAPLRIHQDQYLEKLRKRTAHHTNMSKRLVKS